MVIITNTSGKECNTIVTAILNQTPCILPFKCYNFQCASKDKPYQNKTKQ